MRGVRVREMLEVYHRGRGGRGGGNSSLTGIARGCPEVPRRQISYKPPIRNVDPAVTCRGERAASDGDYKKEN